MSKQYIFFDLDGTLAKTDSGITASLKYSLTKFGIHAADSDLKNTIGIHLIDIYTQRFGLDQEQTKQAITHFNEYYKKHGMQGVQLFSGVKTMLQKLKAEGKTIALVTGKPIFYATQIISRFDVLHLIDFVSGTITDKINTTKQELIQNALTHFGLTDVKDVVMVGDTVPDVVGAKAHNMDLVMVTYGYGVLQNLKNAGANIFVSSTQELTETLLR